MARACIYALVQGDAPVELGDPCPQAPVGGLLMPPPLHCHHHLPHYPLFCSMGSNMWPEPCGDWGLSPPTSAVSQHIDACGWGFDRVECVSVYVWIHACICVLWKDEATNTERPSQVKWYYPQQGLYIATQTGLQDKYKVFWLNTETAQPCRRKERDCNRQDSSGAVFVWAVMVHIR